MTYEPTEAPFESEAVIEGVTGYKQHVKQCAHLARLGIKFFKDKHGRPKVFKGELRANHPQSRHEEEPRLEGLSSD